MIKKYRKGHTGTKNDPRYKYWREEVLRRDSRRCLSCGETYKVAVQYILPLKVLTYNVDDGITLCSPCKFHLRESEDFEWIARCLIMDQKFKNKEKTNGKEKS